MTKSINDYITIQQKESGDTEIVYTKKNEENIFNYLAKQGLGTLILDGKRVYYHKKTDSIEIISLEDIQNSFIKHIKVAVFEDVPEDVNTELILRGFDACITIIRKTKIFDYLSFELSPEDIFRLKLATSSNNLYRSNVKKLLIQFDEWKLMKMINQSTFLKINNPIYYKSIGDKKFLIFSHNNHMDKDTSTFDCYTAKYANDYDLGKKNPIQSECIKIKFNLRLDMALIKDYLS